MESEGTTHKQNSYSTRTSSDRVVTSNYAESGITGRQGTDSGRKRKEGGTGRRALQHPHANAAAAATTAANTTQAPAAPAAPAGGGLRSVHGPACFSTLPPRPTNNVDLDS